MEKSGFDITIALLIFNMAAIGFVGYLIRQWLEDIKKAKELGQQNKIDMQLYKKEIDASVTLMSKLVEKDMGNLNASVRDLANSIKELHERIQQKDVQLIAELKMVIKEKFNG